MQLSPDEYRIYDMGQRVLLPSSLASTDNNCFPASYWWLTDKDILKFPSQKAELEFLESSSWDVILFHRWLIDLPPPIYLKRLEQIQQTSEILVFLCNKPAHQGGQAIQGHTVALRGNQVFDPGVGGEKPYVGRIVSLEDWLSVFGSGDRYGITAIYQKPQFPVS